MPTFLITGCSRGLGLALSIELAKAGHNIIATSRGDPNPALANLIASPHDQVHHFKLDVTDLESATSAKDNIESFLGDRGVDVLITNAEIINWMTEGIEKTSVVPILRAAN